MEPLPYLEFLALQQQASIVITDSGGIQEETTFLGVPCLTVRENTERPITVEKGTNQLVGRDLKKLRSAAEEILAVQTSEDRQVHDTPMGRTRSRTHRTNYCAMLSRVKIAGERSRLQLGACVRVDFAVQANFFKSRCCPFHKSPSGPNRDREFKDRIAQASLVRQWHSAKNKSAKLSEDFGICALPKVCNILHPSSQMLDF